MIDRKANSWLKYPTPLHIYWGDRAKADANSLVTGIRQHLPQAQFFYSAKTNPLPALLKQLHDIGWGLEVVNPGDLALAQKTRSRKIVVNSIIPDVSVYESILSSRRTVALHIESMDGADAVVQAAEKIKSGIRLLGSKMRARIGLRIADGNSHFGFPCNQEALSAVAKKFSAAGLTISSLHIHTNNDGSLKDLDGYRTGYLKNIDILLNAKEILAGTGHDNILSIDLGGGIDHPAVFRVPSQKLGNYHSGNLVRPQQNFTLEEIAEQVGRGLSDRLKQKELEHLEIFFEFGRAVSTRALDTVLTVQAVKNNFYPNASVAITDGSTALLGPIHRAIHPFETDSNRPPRRVFIYGKLPHSADWLAQNIELPGLERGDHLTIKYTGAYFIPLEARFGNSIPAIVSAETNSVLRQAEKISSWTSLYKT
jgi:diaminopimelate decarboxylase